MAGKSRTLQEAQAVAEQAKLDLTDLNSSVQSLYLSQDMGDHEVRLVELDSSMVKHLEAGNSLMVRGDKSDMAVVCTDDSTFELKSTQTTNSLLLLPDCRAPEQLVGGDGCLLHKEVYCISHVYLELKQCRPKLKKLQTLLQENVFTGPEYESDEKHTGKKYTTTDLLSLIQASEKELLQELWKLHAVHYDGYWRLVDFDYMGNVLQYIMDTVDCQSWSYDQIPTDKLLSMEDNVYPRVVLQHCLDCYGDRKIMELDGGPEEVHVLSEDKVCRYFAEYLLKGVGKFNLAEFLQTWKESVPVGMTTDLEQLEGVALIDKKSHPQVISHFPVTGLPEDAPDRFNRLFRTREKWTLEDITPYIRDLCERKQTVGSLLTKFARASTLPDGTKVYNSRVPIK